MKNSTDQMLWLTVAFTYAPGRSGEHAVDILKGFVGCLQVDGYTGYNRVIDPKRQANIRLVYCWAYARRKLFELTKNSAAPIAQEGLEGADPSYNQCSQALHSLGENPPGDTRNTDFPTTHSVADPRGPRLCNCQARRGSGPCSER